MKAVEGWSSLQVAVGCRLYADAAMALRNGVVEPPQEAEAQAALLRIASEVPSWEAPLPVCQATLRLARAALAGWSPTRHWLHHARHREVVVTVMQIAERFRRQTPPLVSHPAQSRLLEASASAATASAGVEAGVEAVGTLLSQTPPPSPPCMQGTACSTHAAQNEKGTEEGAAMALASAADAPSSPSSTAPQLPLMPPEMWISILKFVLRSHFPPIHTAADLLVEAASSLASTKVRPLCVTSMCENLNHLEHLE